MDLIPNRKGEWHTISVLKPLLHRLQAVKKHDPHIAVSGDCMVSLAMHPDHSQNIAWFDAHGDFNTPITTYTGNLGGMPLAMLAGLGGDELRSCLNIRSIDPQSIALIGASKLDNEEATTLRTLNVWSLSVPDFYKVRPSIANMPDGFLANPIHLHIDTDVVNVSELPGAFHPSDTGIAMKELMEWFEFLIPFTSRLSIKTNDPRHDPGRVGEELVLWMVERAEEKMQR